MDEVSRVFLFYFKKAMKDFVKYCKAHYLDYEKFYTEDK